MLRSATTLVGDATTLLNQVAEDTFACILLQVHKSMPPSSLHGSEQCFCGVTSHLCELLS